jgi:nitrous oxide reductase accessory protein NosL
VDLPDGSKLDLSAACPICNMKLESSTLGPAAVVFKDGKIVGFDGTGDMFRYVLDAGKHGFDPANIKQLFVTEHGTKNFIDAKSASYVVGSDVAGEMGPEVVPFSKKEDAEKFMADHHGKAVASYVQITLDDLKSKKKMLKMKHEDAGSGGMKH